VELSTDLALADFRQEARTWLEENVPDEPRPTTLGREVRDYDAEWQRRQYDGGWAGIDWDAEYGGRGLTLLQQVIWYEEHVRARAPGNGVFAAAIAHAGPTLILRGSNEQKAFYLPRILSGQTPWCQGFSEPGSGSDLASLRCRGVVDGDHIVVTGSKIWTTNAQWADYCELLVRTDPNAAKHKGITWLIASMHLPGIKVRPITSIDGYPHNCEVFFDEVRIPLTEVVDQVNNGWSVAMSTLAEERGPAFLNERLAQITLVDELIDYARESGKLRDEALADRLAQARAMAAALRSTAYYQVSTTRKGEQPKADTTAARTFFVQLQLITGRLAVDVLGPKALEWTPWTQHWLGEFSGPIGGGTVDIQKNIIGERVLGLSR
jgi:alkylation response protein AidB-like acyl-CoA dehydrogenase